MPPLAALPAPLPGSSNGVRVLWPLGPLETPEAFVMLAASSGPFVCSDYVKHQSVEKRFLRKRSINPFSVLRLVYMTFYYFSLSPAAVRG